jgi:type II secretory pathway pseudopilin PulG
MSNSRNKIPESGFSLAEIVIAFGILSLGLVSLAGSFPFGIRINKESENESTATYAAQQGLEKLIATPYSEIATGTIESRQVITSDSDSDLYRFRRDIIVNYVDINFNSTSTDLGLKKITVNVYHNNSIGRNEKKFTSYMLISRKQ